MDSAVQPTDDKLVEVYIKIRNKVAEVNREYVERLEHLKGQQKQVGTEILRRLNERGASQTKTPHGTAFVGEDMSITIADEEAYGAFVLAEQDHTYYQKRAKVERVREYMKAHDGALPPGLSVFRERVINVRVPRKGAKGEPTDDNGGADEHPEE